jgi:hypothetical protein
MSALLERAQTLTLRLDRVQGVRSQGFEHMIGFSAHLAAFAVTS